MRSSLISEASVVFTAAAALWILILIEFKTGTAYGRGPKKHRQESPSAFWLIMFGQTTLALFLTVYALKVIFHPYF